MDTKDSQQNELGKNESVRLSQANRAPILIVDDDPACLLALKEVLGDHRHAIEVASSGSEALNAAERTEFALVLLDVRMPGLSGYDTAAILRRRPRNRATPIFFMTASDASTQEITEAYGLGAADFLQKPLDPVALQRRLTPFVDLYFDRREAKEWARDLAESAERRRLVLEQMPVNLCTVNRDLRITFADGRYVRSQGRSGGQIIGQRVTDFALEAERPKVEAAFRRALEGGASAYESTFEGRVFSAHVQPLYDRKKSIVGAICGFQDVTDQKEAERRAREQQSLLEAFFLATTDAAFVKDASGRYLAVNDAACRLFGFRREDAAGKVDADLLPPAVAEACRRSDARVLETGSPHLTEEEAPLADGLHTFRVSKAPLKGLDGATMGVLGIAHDITDLRRSREELRKSEERFRLAIGVSSDLIWDWDVRADQVTWAGAVEVLEKGAGKVLAWPPGDCFGRWGGRIHPEDRDRVVGAVRRALKEGAESYLEEYRFRRADGSFGWFMDRANIYRDAEGKPLRVVGAMLDVTERKEAAIKLEYGRKEFEAQLARLYAEARREIDERRKAEHSLRESEERFRSLCSSSPIGIFTADTEGLCTYSNPRCQELLGVSEHRALGQGWARKILSEDRGRALTGWVRAISTGAPYAEDLQVSLEGGGRHVVQVRATPMLGDDERVLGYVGTVEDITERQSREEQALEHRRELERSVEERMAQLREALATLDSFAHSAAHDLRTPLRGISGFLEMLEEDSGPALGTESLQYLQGARRAAQKLDRFVADLLALSRMERQEVKLLPVETEAVLREVLAELSPAVAAAGADVVVAGPLPRVVADPTLLAQILRNLVANAIKFVRPGESPKVEVGASTAEGVVRLRVRDNGIGVPDVERSRLFKTFERIPSDYTFEGSGLGLATVRRAAGRMGGRTGMESGPGGKGSEFWVELPPA